MRRLWIVIVLLTACGTGPAPVTQVSISPSARQSTPTPGPTPNASSFLAVFYDRVAHQLALVDSNGTQVASVTATEPQRYNAALPWTSASLKRLYYLTDGGDVRFLQADGTTGLATHIALQAGENAGFSVSPDDVKIAVAILGYGSAYIGMRMYVEDLGGGGHHVEIYSSSINAEFPIAWTGGRLIIALGTPVCCRLGSLNPYGAVEYHVADPATGQRFVTLCRTGRGPVGPPAAIGVICGLTGGPNGYLRWDASSFTEPGAAPDGALSPDGAWVAISQGNIWLSRAGQPIHTSVAGNVAGWLDLDHIVYRDPSTSDFFIGHLLLLANGPRVPMPGASTDYLGTLPTAIT